MKSLRSFSTLLLSGMLLALAACQHDDPEPTPTPPTAVTPLGTSTGSWLANKQLYTAAAEAIRFNNGRSVILDFTLTDDPDYGHIFLEFSTLRDLNGTSGFRGYRITHSDKAGNYGGEFANDQTGVGSLRATLVFNSDSTYSGTFSGTGRIPGDKDVVIADGVFTHVRVRR
jgi:hypothetical protein